jgi:uncharacterized membrane protein
MRRDWRGFATSLVLTWVAVGAVVLGAPAVLTVPAGLLLVALPGFVWPRAFHRRSMAPVERWTLVAALDLGLLVAMAFVLNAVPGGLRATSWAVALASVITVGTVVGLVRGGLSATNIGDASPPGLGPAPRITARQLVAIGVGVAALVAAGVVSVASGHTSNDEHFTELSLAPCPPTGHPTSAVLLITNREWATTRYRVVYATGSKTARRAITLEVGASYRRLVPVSGGAASVALYRSSHAYRHVWIGDPQGSSHVGSRAFTPPSWGSALESRC